MREVQVAVRLPYWPEQRGAWQKLGCIIRVCEYLLFLLHTLSRQKFFGRRRHRPQVFESSCEGLVRTLSTIGGRFLSGFSGVLAASVGWGAFFLLTASFIIPALLVLAILPKTIEAKSTLPAV